ncbi:MAG: cytochrome P450 [Steroidobacteraceae bacterium]|nr:cytochrome P450 [Steroidobacteraceae bacterium]
MNETTTATQLPPEAPEAFDIGASDDSLPRMSRLFGELGDIYRVYAPSRRAHTWLSNHPDDIKRVLVSNHRNYVKGIGFDRVRILLGNGIVTSDGELWRRQRYMMQPMFHRRVLTQYGRMINEANDRFLAGWAAQAARGERVNVTNDMSALALEVILRALFGTDLDVLAAQPGGNPFDIFTDESARDLKFAYRFRQLTRQIAQLIERRRTEPPESHFDFLGMLMAARDRETGQGMTEREMIDEVTTLIVAGHETTANTLNWAWYLISQHPQIEAKMHAEIDAMPEEEAPALARIEELKYTKNVLDETLRLYPPVWVFSRRAVGADVLSGYALPAGTDLLLSPYHLHRHPRYWKAPEEFHPERFDAEHEAERPRFAYMPFSAGPRHCIGEAFSFFEMLIHLSKVGRRYRLRFEHEGPIEFEAQVNLRTRHPLYMTLERR